MTRKALGLSGVKLAKLAGMPQQSLVAYECGRISCPPLRLSKIAAALGVGVSALVPKTSVWSNSENRSKLTL